MNAQDAEEYTQALGQIVAGSWRQIALAKRLGVPKALDLSTEEWVKERLGGYVKMSVTERKDAALELKAGGHSNVAIGEILGCDEKTVRNDASENSEPQDENDNENTETVKPASENSEPAPVDAIAALAAVPGPEYTRAKFSGDTEWCTPKPYVDLAREAMGGIDLDPASNGQAQETVKAKKYFTKADDGLRKEGRGRVWLNPPYARELIPQFIEKMVEEYTSGRATAAVVLTHNSSDTEWWHLALKHCAAMCFTRSRIKFVKNGNPPPGSPPHGQIFFYLGDDVGKFKAVFETIGSVVTRNGWDDERTLARDKTKAA
jgi:hypothetical protein